MLDLMATHPDEVVPGSVQVFDMEVVRDTKDVSFRLARVLPSRWLRLSSPAASWSAPH